MIEINFKNIKKTSDGEHIITFEIIVDTWNEAIEVKQKIENKLKNILENQTTLGDNL